MIKAEDWGALYYAISKESKSGKVELVGIGSTKLICRNSAIDFFLNRYSKISERLISILEQIDVENKGIYYLGSKYTMVYCEAKVYIYGKRYGFNDMRLVPDPTYQEDLVRFAGFKRRIKGEI